MEEQMEQYLVKRCQMTVRESQLRYAAGEYSSPDFETMVRAGWYDWFCRDRSLKPRLDKLWKIVGNVKNDFVLDNYFVWFKNNCPFHAPLYDDRMIAAASPRCLTVG